MNATPARFHDTPHIMQTTIGGVTRYNAVHTGNVITNLRAMTRVWQLRSSTRSQLSQLDDRCLMDIGIARIDAMIETKKWFWQA